MDAQESVMGYEVPKAKQESTLEYGKELRLKTVGT